MAMPTSAAASAGASLMPSPTLATSWPCLLQLADNPLLVLRQQFGRVPRCRALRRWPSPCASLSPVSMTALTPRSLQRLQAGLRIRARFVAHGDQPADRVADDQHGDRLALVVQRSDAVRLLRARRRNAVAQPPVASRGRPPCRRPSRSRPCRRSALGSSAGWQWHLVRFGPVEDRRGQRMARAGFKRGRKRQHFALAERPKRSHRSPGLAFGQRAGLVEGDRGDRAQRLQHRAALHQQAAAGTGRERRRRWRPASRSPARTGSRSAGWQGPCRPIRPTGRPKSSGGTIATRAATDHDTRACNSARSGR